MQHIFLLCYPLMCPSYTVLHPNLQIVPAKPGHIFDDNCSDLAAFNQLFHFPEGRTVKARPGIAVIDEKLQMFEAMLSRIFL